MMNSRPSNAGWWRAVAAGAGLVVAAAAGAPAGAAEKRLAEELGVAAGGSNLLHAFVNPAPIPIVDNAPASLYPSQITVSGQVGTINDAIVLIRNLSHPFPDDIDIMLVSPGGTRVMVQSDAGGSNPAAVLNYAIGNSQVFDGVHLPDTAALTPERFYLPADYEHGLETMPSPAPAGVYHVSTTAFAGENPNGTWSLYVRDDATQHTGTIAGGWNLLLDINDRDEATAVPGTGTSGPAAPYPSTITLEPNAAHGRISKLRVVLSNVSHTFPDDLDVVLQGPDGQTLLLMSDVGGSADLAGTTLTFEDGAPPMPDEGPLPSGTYSPSNVGTGDTFPAPAPAGPYGTSLSQWNNTRSEGTWRLFVVDDVGADIGAIGNWALEMSTVEKGDFSLDGQADLLWRHDLSGENVLWYMEGNTLFTGELTNPTVLADVRWRMVGTHDFNGDRRTDILWRHAQSGENVLWFMDKNTLVSGTFTNPPALADVNWQMAGTGDFNGDAKPDILWRHDVSGENVAWFMNGRTLVSGTFLDPPSFPDTNWKMVGTGYFDPDVQLDILWWHQGSGQLVVWFMDGITLASGELTTPPGLGDTLWRPVATGDYNADGREDIVWRHQGSGQNVLWYMGGANGTTLQSGEFTDPPVFADTQWKIVGPR
jgi:subtilisin-like proprotein convertase family protein